MENNWSTLQWVWPTIKKCIWTCKNHPSLISSWKFQKMIKLLYTPQSSPSCICSCYLFHCYPTVAEVVLASFWQQIDDARDDHAKWRLSRKSHGCSSLVRSPVRVHQEYDWLFRKSWFRALGWYYQRTSAYGLFQWRLYVGQFYTILIIGTVRFTVICQIGPFRLERDKNSIHWLDAKSMTTVHIAPPLDLAISVRVLYSCLRSCCIFRWSIYSFRFNI